MRKADCAMEIRIHRPLTARPLALNVWVVGIAVIFIALLPGTQPSFAQTGDADGYDYLFKEKGPEEPQKADGFEIKEPLFAMVMTFAAQDSLGTWDGMDIMDFSVDGLTKFPLEHLVRFSRVRPVQADRDDWPGVKIRAMWDIVLVGELDPPMPYAILGYHPGSLRVTRVLRMAETVIDSVTLEGKDGPVPIRDLRIFRIAEGHVVLDVDGWLDFVLGSKLDDAAVLAFVSGSTPTSRVSIAVSVGRKGKSIFGEFSMAQDKVLPNGGKLASSLSKFCRNPILSGLDDPIAYAWGKWND